MVSFSITFAGIVLLLNLFGLLGVAIFYFQRVALKCCICLHCYSISPVLEILSSHFPIFITFPSEIVYCDTLVKGQVGD